MEDQQRIVHGLLALAESLCSGGTLSERSGDLCRLATVLLRCDRASIFLERNGVCRAYSNFGNPPDIAELFPKHRVALTDPLLQEARASSNGFVVVNDTMESPLINREFAQAARIRAIVLAPLLGPANQLLGFFTAEYNENTGRFSETDSILVLGIARLAQGAIVGEHRDRDRAALAEDKKQLSAQLQEAQRLESLGRLAGGIAHDFNNQLAAIAGYASLLKDQLADSPELAADLDPILASTDRASTLTAQLLDFGRRQHLEPRVLQLRGLLDQLEPMLRHLTPEDVELEIDPGPPGARVNADAAKLEQVIVNLVLNARDAMPSGGRLRLEISEATPTQAELSAYRTAREQRYVVLAVSDTGEGMPPEIEALVFEPFFTTKGLGRGSGLGLPTSLGIVEQSGGFLALDTAPGRGSTFRVHLPRVEAGEETVEHPPQRKPAQRGSERVLLVEDEEILRTYAGRVLRGLGYQVVDTARGSDALRFLRAAELPFDLLVTDIVMPEMGGPELARRLRQHQPGLHVLYVSGYADDAILQRGPLEPEFPLLRKPYRPGELAGAVRRALA